MFYVLEKCFDRLVIRILVVLVYLNKVLTNLWLSADNVLITASCNRLGIMNHTGSPRD